MIYLYPEKDVSLAETFDLSEEFDLSEPLGEFFFSDLLGPADVTAPETGKGKYKISPISVQGVYSFD